MPDEWGYPASSAPQVSSMPFLTHMNSEHALTKLGYCLTDVQSYVPSVVQTGPTPRGAPQPLPSATPTPPLCRYPNCHSPVTWDKRTYEYAEYCGVEHMRFVIVLADSLSRSDAESSPVPGYPRDAVQHLGVPLCSACGKYPRRTNSKFCGSLCETWALQRGHQMPLSQEPRGQQEHHHWHQQHQQRQHWQPPPTVGSQYNVSNVGAVTGTWSNAPRGSAPPNNGSQHNWQGRY
jgi:hypothetical protein